MPPRGWKKLPKTKRPPIPKVPVVGGKALRGRPRRDGMPPIQKVALLTPQQVAERAIAHASAAFLAKIRHLAGRGVPPKFIAVLLNRDFPGAPGAPTVTEDFEAGGRFYTIAMEGKGDAVLEVAEGMFDRAKSATGKGVDPLFWLKCNADWSETPAGRVKARAADEDDGGITGIDITVTD